MPPDPVLALLAFAGLILYVVVGAVVAPLIIRPMMDRHQVSDFVHNGGNGNNAAPYVLAVMFWPFVVAAGMVVCFFAVPFWVGGKVSRYVASWTLGRGE